MANKGAFVALLRYYVGSKVSKWVVVGMLPCTGVGIALVPVCAGALGGADDKRGTGERGLKYCGGWGLWLG